MRTVGTYLAIFGIASVILSFFNMELRILMWIDMWGASVGWGIRIGLIVLGAILFFAGKAPEEEVPE
ncbi:hypothetical protein [Kordia jejudonensis]|uniref:hypothetical protein n=1 Tax=Kordia jejudonensis TaxID=1348245 RepID=UPI00062960DD|nr:hypothetical protein [Kordia jejudonensis]